MVHKRKVKALQINKEKRKLLFVNNIERIAHNKKLLLKYYPQCNYFIYRTCKKIGISRNTFQSYYRDDEEFREAIDQMNEDKIDKMEESLERKTVNDTIANMFWLKCKGRKRGWNERITIDVSPETKLVPNEVIDGAVESAVRAEMDRIKLNNMENLNAES